MIEKRKCTWCKKYMWLLIQVLVLVVSIFSDLCIKRERIIPNQLIEIMIECLTVGVGFLVTCYLLYVELYKDRYPMKYVRENTLPRIKIGIEEIGLCILYGGISISLDNTFVTSFGFFVCSALSLFFSLKRIIGTSKNMLISSYVKKYCNDISEKIGKHENSITDTTFSDLRKILGECIMKEEYSVADSIVKGSGNVFRDFLKNAVALIEEGEDREKIEKTFDDIVEFGITQIEMCGDISLNMITSDIIWQQYENIVLCIDTNQLEWYKKYIKKLALMIYEDVRSEKEKELALLGDLLISVLTKVLEQKKEDWAKYLVEEMTNANVLSGNSKANVYSKEYIRFITYGLTRKVNSELDNYMYDSFRKYTLLLLHYGDKIGDAIVYYRLYFHHLMKEKNHDKIKRFFKLIVVDRIETNLSDSAWMEYKKYCVDTLLKEEPENEEYQKYQYELSNEIIEMKGIYKGSFALPDFKIQLKRKGNASEKIEEICNDIWELFVKTIINDNMDYYYYLIQNLKECILSLGKEQKEIQKSVFDIYINLIRRADTVSNKQFIEIAFFELGEVIEKMDDEKRISDSFGKYIIENIISLAGGHYKNSKNLIQIATDYLHSFVNEGNKYRFISDKEMKKLIGRGLYNIGVNCIENDYEDGARIVSNTMGWFIVNCIKQSNSDVAKYLINLVGSMLEVAVSMEISKKTKIFLLTLFTTVGMYCCKDSALNVYEREVLNQIKNISKDEVEVAINVRTHENDMFNDLYENNTEFCAKRFKEDFDKMLNKH